MEDMVLIRIEWSTEVPTAIHFSKSEIRLTQFSLINALSKYQARLHRPSALRTYSLPDRNYSFVRTANAGSADVNVPLPEA